ncbi:defender against death DAD protein [Yamadazyma tenuis ATCC 10573]|uniref:Dolichyl-diphosphooligosaccharide--protein glycosyltransferase subunit OST2 n=1 Tax=Candida tenuis (strain ATCC 10573 / BCRC 21748 / CBS 615 / JCM 9827 / NBRC 10315 / NRRL Y-1498 / VKM Y-70) TaxID=590646 RepID=G3BBE4_CANTC|nr:defender against death DAD protein [Yamadazyma tenuis ATCC 10573]EGV62168.1 defender against death DAD protein [Yamadazyma tenuis ATCC 10573]
MAKPKTSKPSTKTLGELRSAATTTYTNYVKSLTPRTKLIDTFLAFLVTLGALQFVYVLLIGNFPFNAFLGGFISCVGQFVLTVNLRLQYNEQNFSLFKSTPERSFGDFIFASLILHFIVYHFIN